MSEDAGSYEIVTAALGLLNATVQDGHHSGPVTLEYLSGVATDRSQSLSLIAGMTALATMLMQMRDEETGVGTEQTLAELGRRIRDALSDSG